jgi:hypothetical protein
MTLRVVLAASVAVMFLAACQLSSAPDQPSAAAKSQPGAMSLPAQKLAPGACGLFAWTREESPRFIFFREARKPEARFFGGDKDQRIALRSESGDVVGQFLTLQEFAGANGARIQLSFERGEDIEGGTRTDQARLQILGKDGWEQIIPLSVVTACEPG